MSHTLRFLIVLFVLCVSGTLRAQDGVIISEFLASNSQGLRDEDGDRPDWVEIYNGGANPVNLNGWRLSDNPGNLSKWIFPAVTLEPKGFLLVFASGKDRRDPSAPLHASFKISASGGYLGLIRANGSVASQFNPYPAQYTDRPYGFRQTVSTQQLVGPVQSLKYLVPTGSTPTNATWTARTFSDSTWPNGMNGVGYESTVPGWALSVYFSNQFLGNLSTAESVITNPAFQTNVQASNHPVVNYNNSSSPGNYTPENPPPALASGEFDNYVVEGTGFITVPSGGTWTFCVTSDDGCALKIRNVGSTTAWSSVPNVLAFTGGRAMGSSFGTYNFPAAGDYEIRVVIFEGGGGSGGEVSARQGSFSSGPWSSDFRLIGDTGSGGLAIKSLPVGIGGSGFQPFVGTNVKALMLDAVPPKSSCYVRYAFTGPAGLTSLSMPIRYDDGFVAYLNGVEVARRNAPAGTPGNLTTATGNRHPGLATRPETIDLTPHLAQVLQGQTNILAIHGLNESAGDSDFLIRAELARYNVTLVETPVYFVDPTPFGFNTAPEFFKVSPVVASVERGFYSAAQSVALICATPGATIRYTFDGSTPTLAPGASATYTGPITINKTTTLRYAAFLTGYEPSEVVTQTYLFTSDIIGQSPTGEAPVITNPPGAAQATTVWPQGTADANGIYRINSQIMDYGMDPEVVQANLATIQDDLKAIPSFSIVTDLGNLLDPSQGIHVNPSQDGIVWERPASIELIHPDGATEGFQANCGIRIRGGFSRSGANPKHAFRLFFRRSYGVGTLEYPLFGDAPGKAREFDKFDLRCAQNYSWSFQGDANGIFIRDPVARDMQLATGNVSSHGGFYHLYVNGQYWGLFNVDERPEANFGATYFGGNPEDYDTIKSDPDLSYSIEATDGNLDAWFEFWQLADGGLSASASETANNATYQRMMGRDPDGSPNASYPVLLDPVNLIDMMCIIFWGGNLDAPISNFLNNQSPNNWFGFRNRTGLHGGFKFVLHDSEHTMLPWNANVDRTGPWPAGSSTATGGGGFPKSNPQYIFQQCIHAGEFRSLFVDRVFKHFSNNGVLTPQGALPFFEARVSEIDRAVVAESARWGDAKREPPLGRSHWLTAVSSVRNTFIPGRTATVLNQFRSKGWYPAFDPALIVPRGGTVAPSSNFTLALAPGSPGGSTIYYTTDGSDPRLPGGALNPNAQTAVSGQPIPILTSQTVRTRVRSGTTWSAIDEVTFYVTQDFSVLAVTEIHYNPLPDGATSGNDLEFIELKNTGSSPLDLGGLSFSGITFSFPLGTTIAPNGLVVLVRNAAAFASRYPGVAFLGAYTGQLDNSGERIALNTAQGGTVFSLTYDDQAPWPAAPDGHGFSLVPTGSRFNSSHGRDWRASAAVHGSPGTDDPPVSIAPIVINELLSNSASPLVDTVELHNPGSQPADIGHWWLTDNPNVPQKYRIPAGTVIPAGGYIVFDEGHFNPNPGVAPSFAFSSNGDDGYLFSGNAAGQLTGYSHGLEYAAAEPNVSFGRYINSVGEESFPRQISRTFGAANSGPLVGPLVISEIMYHPYEGYDEFVEIRNIGGTTVPLFDPANPANTWKLGGAAFSFPAGQTIPPGGHALVVGVDPASFRLKYGISSSVAIYGPYAGVLQNGGERLSLEKPAPPVGGVPPYIVIDSVRYDDEAPWPVAADGGGPSLQRLNANGYADDPANWFASGATPGALNAENQPPSVSLTAPATGAVFTLPANINFSASAVDPDGSIVKVEFFVNGGKVGEAASAPYNFTWAATGGVHNCFARAIDNSLGVRDSSSVTLYVTTPVNQGLKGEYFVNAENWTTGPAGIRIDPTVNFSSTQNWPANTGFPGIANSNYSVRWMGQVRPPASGSYTFYINSDDGSFLYLNGALVINNGGYHGPVELSFTANLTGGVLYPIRMDMFQGGGGAVAQLSWQGPGIAKQIIPQTVLYPDSAPIVVTQPSNLTREMGAIAIFSVVASGSGNSYQWLRNGTPIAGAAGSTLPIPFVLPSHAGSYAVLISNSSGFATSNPVTLTVTITDADNDGIQDAWELANGLNPGNAADALLDSDGDGVSNLDEYRAGTDPRDPNSVLRARVVRLGDGWHVQFTAMAHRMYSVWYRENLTSGAWMKLQDISIAAVTREVSVHDSGATASGQRFYRVMAPGP